MHSASKEGYAAAAGELEQIARVGDSGDTLGRLADELYGVAGVLDEHLDLRRHLVDPAVPEQGRTGLIDRIFSGKVGERTRRLLRTLVSTRMSTSADLVEAVENLGRNASLAGAEADDRLSEVEDELFRFGRILDREPRLRTLLSDTSVSADSRVGLLDSVLGDRVDAATRRLLSQAVRRPTARPLDRTAEVLAEAAAARRNRSIARVTSPVVLGDEQERRLADALSGLYGRRISVHVDVDPDILGGLVVRVGDEVIDGSMAGHLRRATGALPG